MTPPEPPHLTALSQRVRTFVRAAAIVTLWTTLSVAAAHAKVLCTAVADATTGVVVKRDGVCDTRVTAASTFKIAISLMGYDSDFLKDKHSPALPFPQGYPEWVPAWRTTTDPTSWIKNSVVWYSQQVTTALGEKQFARYVTEFHYGNEDVSGDPGKHDGLTRAWLSSSLKISPLEEVAFLERIATRQLPVSARAYEMTSRITDLDALPGGSDIHGKTGTGAPVMSNGSKDWDHAFGWFVGWAAKGERTVVFARLIQDEKKQPVGAGLRARDAFMRELPSILESL